MKNLPYFLFIFLWSTLFFLTEANAQSSPLIRVKILEGKKDIEVDACGPYELKWGKGAQFSQILTSSQKIRTTLEGMSIDDKILGGEILIKPGRENSLIVIDKRRYRGEIIVHQKGTLLEIINQLPLEEYLYGVIKWEISPSWPLASLETQAIVARTYALKKLKNSSAKHQGYHLSNTVMDQIYEGVETETPTGTKAINLTRGKVLTYKGELANAYYHACCGGYTASSKDVWGEEFPYLRARPDRFCQGTPYCEWELVIEVKELRKILRERECSLGKIYRIEPVSLDEGGRVRELYIEHRGGRKCLKGTEFRKLMGPDCLKSTLFKVKRWANYFIFTGKGWGHGVGMCQWGAKRMAEKGYSTEEILEFYYPGTKIEKIY